MTRAQLLAAYSAVRTVRTLHDLAEWENVWTVHVELRAVGHRSADGRKSVCGQLVLSWPIAAGHLAALSGSLCQDGCWTNETPAGSEPVGN